jgi:large subunit ribosomal protein L28
MGSPAGRKSRQTGKSHKQKYRFQLRNGSMARKCEICGKGPQSGSRISHAHNVSNRKFYPNLQNVHVLVGGQKKKMRVCTRCIRSGRVEKAL